MSSAVCLKPGVRPPVWVNKLKIALAAGDLKTIEKITLEIPEGMTLEEQREAAFLIQNAITQFESQKRVTLDEMTQIKKNLQFIRSIARPSTKKLDITS